MATITFNYTDSNDVQQNKVATINLATANKIAANIGYQATVRDPARVAAVQAQQAVVDALASDDPSYLAELETLLTLRREMDDQANFIANPIGLEDAVYTAIKNKLLELLRDNSAVTTASETAKVIEEQNQDTSNETTLGL